MSEIVEKIRANEKLMDICDERLSYYNKAMRRNGFICYGGYGSVGGVGFYEGHGYCHSWLPNDSDSCIVLNALCLSHSKRVCLLKNWKQFILWIANDLPFSKFVVNRDNKEQLFNKGIILYMSKKDGLTYAQCLWICKALRHATEGGHTIDCWAALCQQGVDPLVAFYFACNFSIRKARTEIQFRLNPVPEHPRIFDKHKFASVSKLVKRELNPPSVVKNTDELFADLTKENPRRGVVRLHQQSWIVGAFPGTQEVDDGWGGTVNVPAWANARDIAAKIFEHHPEARI